MIRKTQSRRKALEPLGAREVETATMFCEKVCGQQDVVKRITQHHTLALLPPKQARGIVLTGGSWQLFGTRKVIRRVINLGAWTATSAVPDGTGTPWHRGGCRDARFG